LRPIAVTAPCWLTAIWLRPLLFLHPLYFCDRVLTPPPHRRSHPNMRDGRARRRKRRRRERPTQAEQEYPVATPLCRSPSSPKVAMVFYFRLRLSFPFLSFPFLFFWKCLLIASVHTGCVTCKAKRLKCGEEKPGCQQCKRRNVECGGYKKDFKWRPFEETNVKINIDRQKRGLF